MGEIQRVSHRATVQVEVTTPEPDPEPEPDPVDVLEQLPDNAKMAGIVDEPPLPDDSDYTESEDEEDEPDEDTPQTSQEAADEVKHICPKCGREMRLRNGKNGEFWGCSGYPDCRHTENIKAVS